MGTACDIIIGTHGQMTAAGALRIARRLEKFDPLWFEEPCPPENIKALADVARRTTIPIATGERLTTKFDFARLLEHRAAAIFNFAFPPVPTACAAQIDSKVFTYIAAIDDRRVFAADPVTGLVMGLSMFRHPMDNVPYEVTLGDGTTTMFAPAFAPFDLPAAHIFKIRPDRQIHEIEAMGFVAPYGSASAR